MNANTLFFTVRSLIFDILKIPAERIRPETRLLEDLDVDLPDLHQLAMSLEEVLSLEIPSDDIVKLHTVGELVDYLSHQPKSHCVGQGS